MLRGETRGWAFRVFSRRDSVGGQCQGAEPRTWGSRAAATGRLAQQSGFG